MTSGGRRGPALAIGSVLGGLAAVAGLAITRRLDTVEVRGRSMVPALLPGDRLLVTRLGREPRVGDVVVATDPLDGRRELVKRVRAVGSTTVSLASDDPAGRDADVMPDAIRWRVALRYWPPRRVGRVSRGRSRPAVSPPPTH